MGSLQNVTLSIPKHIYRKAKLLATQKNISLSELITQALNDLIARQEGYDQAKQRNIALLRKNFDLGTQGQIPWKREDLHDR